LLSALACAMLVTCGVLMLILIRQLDANAAAAEMAEVSAGVDDRLTAERTSASSTARWDDAVIHLYGQIDAHWAFANLSGPYRTYIIDEQGRTLFSRRANGTIDPPIGQAAPAALAQLLRLLPHDRAGAARLKEGVGIAGYYHGRPAVFGAAPVTPLQGKARVPSDDMLYLLYVDDIGPPLLRRWSERYGISPIAMTAEAGAAGLNLPLRDAAGRTIAWFNWQPKSPGRQAMANIIPALAIAIAVLAGVFALLARMLRSQERALNQRNAEQVALTDEAERLRTEAERALEAARASRRLTDEAAARAVQERELHARELREAAHEAGRSLRAALAVTLPDLVALADRLDQGTDLAAASTRTQAQHAADVVRRTSEAAAALEHIALNTDRMATASAAIGGETAKTREAVSGAAGSSSAAAESNSALLHHVTTIGEATALISAVAEQTNLLALNATIEAARAHAENAGFAVVAREIKSLSQDTQASATLINDRVIAVQNAVHESVERSRGIDAQLRQIHDHIAKAADAAAEQAAASGGIRSSVAAAREQAVAVDASMSQISGAITELAGTAEASREISHQMRGRAQQLRNDLDVVIADLMGR
jgi:methyl-accepting chemotaxis protein